MRNTRNLFAALTCVGLLAIAFPSPAQANAFNETTFFSFRAPVALPGISLPAGTYMFKLADPNGDRSVVQVFNHDGTVCYGTFLTVPDAQLTTVDRPSVRLEERTAMAPEAIRTWFYPGDETGREFFYPELSSSH